jgi:hypothetical protein
MEPRAGFDPATNSLQGCRSTGLSHRGTQFLPDLLMFLDGLTYRFSVSKTAKKEKLGAAPFSRFILRIFQVRCSRHTFLWR